MIKQIVTSKYFQKTGMEESLTDFEEKRKTCTGPKTNKNAKVKREKPKKRIRGQKDIRTLIKPNKNELLTYTKDFNNICAHSGVDIDSQQLQLAIALSKSLQQPGQIEEENLHSTKILSSQERSNRIRRTLQEYGFKIPDTKVKVNGNKRAKKSIKPCKLLLISEEERRQKISDRYSQILLGNPGVFGKDDNVSTIFDTGLYFLATNIPYELMKTNKIFYTEILEEISVSKGNLLREWSDIPGRPSSPKLVEDYVVSIPNLQCTQVELDTILSGTLKEAKDICKLNINNSLYFNKKFQLEHNKCDETLMVNTEKSQNTDEPHTLNQSILKKVKSDHENPSIILSLPQQDRCPSPDIFDDEESTVINNSIRDTDQYIKNGISKTDFPISMEVTNISGPSFQSSQNITNRKTNDFMDLTECVPISSQNHKTKLLSNIENIDEVQIIHDCMEITECVNPMSQKSINRNDNHFDLVHNCDDNAHVEIKNDSVLSKGSIKTLDLTQSSNSDDDLPAVEIYGTQKSSLDDTIIVHYHKNSLEPTQQIILNGDMALSKDNKQLNSDIQEKKNYVDRVDDSVLYISENLLPYSSINVPNRSQLGDDSQDINDLKNASFKSKDILLFGDLHEENNIDLTQSSDTTTEYDNVSFNIDNVSEDLQPCDYNSLEKLPNSSTNTTRSQLGDNSQDINELKDASLKSKNIVLTTDLLDENSKIDLTQSSDSTEIVHESSNIGNNSGNLKSSDSNSLGKKNDVSIDYDEISFDSIANVHSIDEHFHSVQSKISDTSESSKKKENYFEHVKSDSIVNSSNISEAFEISDKEFNYSLCKSNVENFDLGGVSYLNEFSNIQKSKNITNMKTNCTTNSSLSESYLPMVNVKHNKDTNDMNKQTEAYITFSESTCVTPIKAIVSENKVSIQTPTNSDYIVKFGVVTPMLDYAAMSTPERNKELEKYGLKPFKRKRAIQLLTHLYNQTHPIIEHCSQEPIQKKKFKPNTDGKSPKKGTSPRKPNTVSVNESNIYVETKENPDIRNIECGVDDWLFQKKEKAKVHSCRVPLHIAFHNYVSCRRHLREAILRYEPINIDVVHKDLVSYGYKYNPKDLLKYLDRKCITVKTADNSARNSKK